MGLFPRIIWNFLSEKMVLFHKEDYYSTFVFCALQQATVENNLMVLLLCLYLCIVFLHCVVDTFT